MLGIFFKVLQLLDACFVRPSGWLAFFSRLFPPPSSLFNNTEVVYSFWMKSQIGYWGCVLQLRGPLPHCRCVRSNSSHRSPLVPERSIAQDEAMEADNDATLFTCGHPITAERGPLINMLKLVVSATNNSLLCRNKKVCPCRLSGVVTGTDTNWSFKLHYHFFHWGKERGCD